MSVLCGIGLFIAGAVFEGLHVAILVRVSRHTTPVKSVESIDEPNIRDTVAFDALRRADRYRDYAERLLQEQGLDGATISELLSRIEDFSDSNGMSSER